MKIINREQFLAMPENTIFAEGEKWTFGPWAIKTETWKNDYIYTPLDWGAMECSDSGNMIDLLELSKDNPTYVLSMDFHVGQRDGCFRDDALYAVMDDNDILMMISRLKECLRG